MKNRYHFKKFIASLLTLCLLIGAMCIGASAKETTKIGWTTYYWGYTPYRYYDKICTEDAGSKDFRGTAIAGRNTENRDSATKRFAAVSVSGTDSDSSYHTSMTVSDWKTGATLYNFDRKIAELQLIDFNYSSPISVFTCVESVLNGTYICVYPTSIGW